MPEIRDAPKKWYIKMATVVSRIKRLPTLHPPFPLICDIPVQEAAVFPFVLHRCQSCDEGSETQTAKHVWIIVL